jgi:hypothetical protein
MANPMVVQAADLEESLADLTTCGALTSPVMKTTWKALDSIRLIAAKLPDYQPGTNPWKNLDRHRNGGRCQG